jgi:DNA-binding CsgD family transcriptional regulator
MPRPMKPEPTPRELQILKLIAAGNTSVEIGTELGIDADTVTNLVASLLRRWDAKSRAHLVAIGFRRQYLS